MKDVIVTWEDNTENCVNTYELKPKVRNESITLGSKVKMRYESKWYYGTVTAVQDDKTGEVKTLTHIDQNQSDKSECCEDDVPLSMLFNQSYNKTTSETKMDIQPTEEAFQTTLDIQTTDDSNFTNCASDQSESLRSIVNMDITMDINSASDVDDPDYRPETSLSPRVLHDYQEETMDHPMLLSCEVPHCKKDIFNSCNTCFLFLCSEHFSEKVPCIMHGNNVQVIQPVPRLDTLSEKEVSLPHSGTKSSITTNSEEIETRSSYNEDAYRPQTCEVPDCSDEVFSSCFRCSILLCWAHFIGDVSCEIHKKKTPKKKATKKVQMLHSTVNSDSHKEIDLSNNKSNNDIEELYPIEGSRREFDLGKEEKINKRKIAKILRNTGQQYVSLAAKKTVPAKSVGAYCKVSNCKENNRQCYLFTEIDRKVIFAEFYSTVETSLKRDFILRHITECEPKQRTLLPKGKVSRRKRSLKYYLSLEGKKYQVCRTFFLNTLAVSEKFVRNSLAKPTQSGILQKEKRGGRVESLKQRDLKINGIIREHINRFPRVESHYCRANSTKEYLHYNLSVKKMHSMLLDEINLPLQEVPGLTCYKKVFKSMNLAFHRPKKDQCSLCAAYHGSTETKTTTLVEKYNIHLLEKNTVRKLKDQDKKEALVKNPKVVCASFDLQQVIFLPITKEGAVFYKRQLSVYNFTIYNIANINCYCFTWPEIESRRGSSEIATAVSTFLAENDVADNKSISLYADGCPGQNKNSIVASALLYCINNATHLEKITLRFFAPNHGQNEGDSAHSAISYALQKAGDIFLPSQLYPIIQMARPSNPYIVRPLQYNDFKDYKDLSQNIKVLSLRQDNESGKDINWTEVVEFKVDKETPRSLFFKTSHTDAAYRSISVKRTQTKFLKEPVRALNNSQIKISKAKYEDLMSLCTGDTAIIRLEEYKTYYKNLPHE